tara:strand:- start:1266 stop:1448 length:183 start_codon:yes stop_codon:yes gene_type:complete
MSNENIKLTPIQTDYKTFLANKAHLKESASNRITQIRKEVNALHLEENKLEDLLKDLTSK